MGEMMNVPKDSNAELLAAIASGSVEEIARVLEEYEGGMSESVLAAAEASGNEDIVASVLDHALLEGFADDYDCPTQIHRVIELGFVMSAKYLAEIITDGDMVEQYQGMTPAEFATSKGMTEVAEMLA